MKLSSPVSRDSLYNERHKMPRPAGCPCNQDPKHKPCGHMTHFEDLRKVLHNRGLKYLGSGSSRMTYASKNGKWVYKVPRDNDGYRDNFFESMAWQDRGNVVCDGVKLGERLSRCRMLANGILVMQRLKKAGAWGSGADEIDETLKETQELGVFGYIDGGQGGLDPEGKFRLYDFTHFVVITDPVPAHWMAI